MDEKAIQRKLLIEARLLDEQIAKINLTDSERKLERIDLLHKYNETKDHSQRILGALAELEGLSTNVLYKRMEINFD